jgi:hypothetical protein
MSTKRPHKGRDRDKARHPDPMKGEVRVGEHSGLRKLMRAARRAKLPEERMLAISVAQTNAQVYRTFVWFNAGAGMRATEAA